VLASVIFAGMSGSAIADAVGPGMVEIEMMCKEQPLLEALRRRGERRLGHHRADHPPSIPMVLYAPRLRRVGGRAFSRGVVPACSWPPQ